MQKEPAYRILNE